MIITDEKITVTYKMMESHGMTRTTDAGLQLGVPDGNGGLKWKALLLVELDEYDAIEDYFLKKQQSDETKA